VSAWPEYLRKKMERGEVAREDEEYNSIMSDKKILRDLDNFSKSQIEERDG